MKKSNIILISITVIAVLVLLAVFTPMLGEIFQANKCSESKYSQTFKFIYNGNTYSLPITTTAKICYPTSLPVWPTEGDTIKLTCSGRALYIGALSDSCTSEGCGGTKVSTTYDYIIKPGDTELSAVCWAKTIDEDLDENKYWVWTSQDVLFTFDGVKPLQIINPDAVCGDDVCDEGETCANCVEDCGSSVTIFGSENPVECDSECGDGLCDEASSETCDNCEKDCGECSIAHFCGDSNCDSDETCDTCIEDCGECDAKEPINWFNIILIGIAIIIIGLIIALIILKRR